ncbi:RNA-binding S4 domain-containing protein [Jiella avicenniae]|uniref:RNA-binding S4 domain-containing protein n=1 Tax=Jiella avicenniae TaxID=2907202 RepID=A0A9X1T5B6_9HYPH|nr:RNA-binding S4 domain-containing protein [Jiella avicenniae]MCE7027677.1 RNA-binding S4 domain-containing protein [Jiella avicenniae]MCE7028719.1 RNA-binding S4 domain-containing protein [Jiella avicenniae]
MDADEDENGPAGKGAQRLDKWLFFARVVKSRTLAQKLVLSGGVRLNRDKITNPARQVRVGDTLTISYARAVRVLKIRQPGARRGPASEAAGLYEDLSPAPIRAASGEDGDEAPRSTPAAAARAPEADAPRPSKKDRRALARLKGGDP